MEPEERANLNQYLTGAGITAVCAVLFFVPFGAVIGLVIFLTMLIIAFSRWKYVAVGMLLSALIVAYIIGYLLISLIVDPPSWG